MVGSLQPQLQSIEIKYCISHSRIKAAANRNEHFSLFMSHLIRSEYF